MSDDVADQAPARAKKQQDGAGAKDGPAEQPAEIDEECSEPVPEPPSSVEGAPGELPSRAELAEAEKSLAGALSPDALSCSGAEPHRDAICSIAARLCEYSRDHPTSVAAGDCLQAKDACTTAKRDFAKNCEQ